MERDPPGGSDVGRDHRARPRRRAAAGDPRQRPDYLAPIDASAPGQRPHAGARITRVAGRLARARLGARPGPHLPGVPPGRDAGPRRSSRSTATPWPRSGREPRPAAARRGAGRAAGRLHDRCRGVRHRGQRRPPAVVGRRSRPRSRTRPCEPRDAGPRRHRGPTRCPATGGSSARTPATAGMPPASCCPRSSPHLAAELGSVRPHPRRAPGTAPPDGRLAAPGRRRTSPRCSPTSSSSSRVAPTSRSTAACSSSWTVASSNSRGRPTA